MMKQTVTGYMIIYIGIFLGIAQDYLLQWQPFQEIMDIHKIFEAGSITYNGVQFHRTDVLQMFSTIWRGFIKGYLWEMKSVFMY